MTQFGWNLPEEIEIPNPLPDGHSREYWNAAENIVAAYWAGRNSELLLHSPDIKDDKE